MVSHSTLIVNYPECFKLETMFINACLLTFEGLVYTNGGSEEDDYLLFPLFHCFSFQPNNSYLSTKLPSSPLSFVTIFKKIIFI